MSCAITGASRAGRTYPPCRRRNAKPARGWENNSDPAKDVKLNVLRKHDDWFRVIQMLPPLHRMGYNYLPSLSATAKKTTGHPLMTSKLGWLGNVSHYFRDLRHVFIEQDQVIFKLDFTRLYRGQCEVVSLTRRNRE